MHGRLEAPQELEPLLAELLARPMGGGELLLRDLLLTKVQGDEEVVGVAVDAGTPELAQEIDAFERLRSALGDVAERDDQVGLVTLQVGERSAEADRVAVHVGDECDPHSPDSTGTP